MTCWQEFVCSLLCGLAALLGAPWPRGLSATPSCLARAVLARCAAASPRRRAREGASAAAHGRLLRYAAPSSAHSDLPTKSGPSNSDFLHKDLIKREFWPGILFWFSSRASSGLLDLPELLLEPPGRLRRPGSSRRMFLGPGEPRGNNTKT